MSFVHADHAVNINTADAETLDTVPEIGPTIAARIVEYREANGPFGTIEEIQNVKGIGPATFEKMKPHITVSGGVGTQTNTQTNYSDKSDSSTPTSGTSPVSSHVVPPTPDIYAHAGNDRVVIVGADTEFVGRAHNKKGESVEPVRFMWNFGDGGTAEGERVMHRWSYPGRYAVTLDVAEAKNAASHRIVVTAEAAELAVFLGSSGAIVVKNESGRDLDLSRWLLSAGGKTFMLPANTVILRGAEVAFPVSITGLNQLFDGTVGLQYPNGIFAVMPKNAEIEPQKTQTPQPKQAEIEAFAPSAPPMPQADSQPDPEEEVLTTAIATSTKFAVAGVTTDGGKMYVWWIGAALISFLGASAVYAIRGKNMGGWKIIDESS